MSDDAHRGTGRTTQQMKAAPRFAVFVWCDRMLLYPKRLARKLGRNDLLIVSLQWVDATVLQSYSLPVVVDHTARDMLSAEKLALIEEHNKVRASRP